MERGFAMVAVGLCAAFSGLTGFGLSLTLYGGAGVEWLSLGVAGLVGVVSLPLRTM